MSKSALRSIDSLAAASCIGIVICWSVGPLFIEYLTGYIDLWTQNALRYIAACLFWLPFLLADARAGRIPRKVWTRALVPLAPNLIMQSLWAAAFYYIDPGFATLLVKTSVIWVAVLSITFFSDERGLVRSTYFWLSLVLSGVGVTGVMLFKYDFQESHTIIGTVIALLFAFMWGLYTVAVKVSMRDVNSRIGFSVISIYTVVGLSVLAMFVGKPGQCLVMPLKVWAAAAVSGIIAIGLGHVLFYVSIHRLGATIPSLVQLSQPFMVIIFSYLLFGESFNALQVIFGIVLLVGSAAAIIAEKDVTLPMPRFGH